MEDSQIKAALEQAAARKEFPDGRAYQSLGTAAVDRLKARTGRKGRDLEILALEAGIIPERYVRNMRQVSMEHQAVLLKSTVCVVGLGGLGGWTTEILARTGVGRLVLVDGDRFEDSNLNRQAMSSPLLLDQSKAKAAGRRVREINPSVGVREHSVFLGPDNADALIQGADLVVDCLDNLPARFVLEKAAKEAGIPMVSAAVAGTCGHVTCVFPEDAGLALIYGQKGDLTEKGAEAALGCTAWAVAFLATLECSEVVKILTNQGQTLRNRLLVADLTDNSIQVLDLFETTGD